MAKGEKANKVAEWIRNHKFWTSVIVLFIVGLILSQLELLNPSGMGEALGFYTFIGSIIWSVQAKKKGLTLITFASYFAIVAVLHWIITLLEARKEDFWSWISISGCFTSLSAVFLFFGIKRYLKWKGGLNETRQDG